MVVCTMTRKQILRTLIIVLSAAAAALIIILAVIGSVTASADKGRTPIYCVDRNDNKIALTFDCAWGNSNTQELLDILSEAGAKATFFVTGEFCDSFPEDVKRFSAAGHSVQNHSDKHPHIIGMNINDLIADIKECENKISMITGKKPRYYRAPYGEYDDNTITTAEGMGYQVIQWSADSIDWEDPDVPTIKKRILDKTQSGSILLFHNDLKNTAEALPSLLTELKQKGFEFVTLEELVYRDGYTVDETGKQISSPDRQTIVPMMYSDDPGLDSAFEKIRENLSIQEIYDLSSVGKVPLIDRIKGFLDEEEIYALREASYAELKEAYNALVYTAERYGAGGAYLTPGETETAPEDSNTAEDINALPEPPRIVLPTDSGEDKYDAAPSEEEKQRISDEPEIK